LHSKKNESGIEPEYIYETDPAWNIVVKSTRVFENNIKVGFLLIDDGTIG
jgi:hypothetical protein